MDEEEELWMNGTVKKRVKMMEWNGIEYQMTSLQRVFSLDRRNKLYEKATIKVTIDDSAVSVFSGGLRPTRIPLSISIIPIVSVFFPQYLIEVTSITPASIEHHRKRSSSS